MLGSYHPLVLASRLAVGREAVKGFSLGGDFKAGWGRSGIKSKGGASNDSAIIGSSSLIVEHGRWWEQE